MKNKIFYKKKAKAQKMQSPNNILKKCSTFLHNPSMCKYSLDNPEGIKCNKTLTIH
jgi:hypothetical protein